MSLRQHRRGSSKGRRPSARRGRRITTRRSPRSTDAPTTWCAQRELGPSFHAPDANQKDQLRAVALTWLRFRCAESCKEMDVKGGEKFWWWVAPSESLCWVSIANSLLQIDDRAPGAAFKLGGLPSSVPVPSPVAVPSSVSISATVTVPVAPSVPVPVPVPPAAASLLPRALLPLPTATTALASPATQHPAGEPRSRHVHNVHMEADLFAPPPPPPPPPPPSSKTMPCPPPPPYCPPPPAALAPPFSRSVSGLALALGPHFFLSSL